MAFSGSFMCTSFKKELLTATHNFAAAGHTFKIALYDNSATLDATTTAYTSSGELASSGGYTQDSKVLASNVDPASGGTTAYTSWSANPAWTSATFTAYGALIYNSSASKKAVAVLDFGGAKVVSSGTFTIVLPTNDSTNAILRIA